MILGIYDRCVNLKVSALLVSCTLNQSVPCSSRSNKRARLKCSSRLLARDYRQHEPTKVVGCWVRQEGTWRRCSAKSRSKINDQRYSTISVCLPSCVVAIAKPCTNRNLVAWSRSVHRHLHHVFVFGHQNCHYHLAAEASIEHLDFVRRYLA